MDSITMATRPLEHSSLVLPGLLSCSYIQNLMVARHWKMKKLGSKGLSLNQISIKRGYNRHGDAPTQHGMYGSHSVSAARHSRNVDSKHLIANSEWYTMPKISATWVTAWKLLCSSMPARALVRFKSYGMNCVPDPQISCLGHSGAVSTCGTCVVWCGVVGCMCLYVHVLLPSPTHTHPSCSHSSLTPPTHSSLLLTLIPHSLPQPHSSPCQQWHPSLPHFLTHPLIPHSRAAVLVLFHFIWNM